MTQQPDALGFADFARAQGWKPGYVTALRKAGRLVLTDDSKRVSVAESLALINATRDPSRAGVAARHAAARLASDTPAAASPAAPPAAAQAGNDADTDADKTADEPEAVTAGYQHWRERREKAAALTAERELDIAEKRLLDAGAVEAAIAAVVTALRTGMEQLPYELAPQLAPLVDEAAVQALLVDVIEEKLRELSRQLSTLSKADAP